MRVVFMIRVFKKLGIYREDAMRRILWIIMVVGVFMAVGSAGAEEFHPSVLTISAPLDS